jgi:hypothetical protein
MVGRSLSFNIIGINRNKMVGLHLKRGSNKKKIEEVGLEV